ncbi:MAG TPA: tetratricopeptide repeat protein [Vicinamibacterales bacterium]|nr:tetratricopeptide repeat protein [Vicinamibacterales bacterium]
MIAAGLSILTLAVFAQVGSHDFVDLDDTGYVVENPHVTTGLTAENIQWAFTPTGYAANWHPLTWISHQIDASLFGTNAGPQHLVNVACHVANVLLLFALLRFMTGAVWRSAFVAGAFAVHPAHVESVAWIAERKDVLSTFFWFAATYMYVAWVRRPAPWRYAAMIGLFVLGLMAKPMLVTLPFTLLLLDVRPLNRTSIPFSRRLFEKLPLFALALASSYVTAVVQQKGGAIGSLELVPMSMRLANAVVAYAHYLRVLVWPSGLAVFYPYIKLLPSVTVIGATAVIAAITAVAWRVRRDQPALLIGWLWFLGTLVPVIGFVQIGTQAYADRYTYIPYVGLFVAIAWVAVAAAERARLGRIVLIGAGAAVVLALAVVAHAQTTTWRDAETLWLQAVAVTTNARGHDQLGVIYARRGELARASAEFQKALQSNPDPSEERLIEPNLGRSLVAQGRAAEALPHLLRAIQYQPDQAEFRHQLALAYIGLARTDDALAAWREAVRINPNYEQAFDGMGMILASRGRNAEAVKAFQEVLRINPSRTDAREAIQRLTGR